MAQETEGLQLDERLDQGVDAVLSGKAAASYYLVEQGGQVSSQTGSALVQ